MKTKLVVFVFILGVIYFSLNRSYSHADAAKAVLTSTKTVTKTQLKTVTVSRTRTLTPSLTSTQTETPTQTSTATNTITLTPSITFTPSPTTVVKTEIKVFDNVSLYPGQKVTSPVYDVSEYSEVSIYLSTNNGTVNTGTCYFIPDGGNITDRYVGITITAVTGSGGFEQIVANGKVIGQNIICDVVNKQYGSNISFFVYFIP